ETQFHPEGLRVQYIGPDGKYLDNDFKIAYTNSFLDQGYRIIYLGDGTSDFPPASKSQHIFACATAGTLLKRCRTANLSCTPFTDLHQVASAIESLE
ncbi:MAG: 2,3-diketo-5-methylthio-1-phosphopentane phosphatase, partial [Chloroflexota bacterium]